MLCLACVEADARSSARNIMVQEVLDEAAQVTGRRPDELSICHIDDPLQELPH